MNHMENSTPLSVVSGRSTKGLLITLGIIILIAVLGVWYVRTVPVNLIGLKVFEGDYTKGKVLSFGIFGLQEQRVRVNGELSDYASAGSTSVAVVRNAETNSEDIVLLSDKSRPLTSDGKGKASLAVSPDGTMIAFATLETPPEGVPFTPQLSSWNVNMLDLKSGEVTLLGTGFAPEFFTSDGKLMLLFTAPTGITIANVAAKNSQTTFFLNPGVIDYAAHISSDGKYLVIPNGLTKHYDFFAIKRIGAPIGLDPLGSAEQILVHGEFKGASFYGVERLPNAVPHLVRFTLTKPLASKEVFTFPINSIYRVIP